MQNDREIEKYTHARTHKTKTMNTIFKSLEICNYLRKLFDRVNNTTVGTEHSRCLVVIVLISILTQKW